MSAGENAAAKPLGSSPRCPVARAASAAALSGGGAAKTAAVHPPGPARPLDGTLHAGTVLTGDPAEEPGILHVAVHHRDGAPTRHAASGEAFRRATNCAADRTAGRSPDSQRAAVSQQAGGVAVGWRLAAGFGPTGGSDARQMPNIPRCFDAVFVAADPAELPFWSATIGARLVDGLIIASASRKMPDELPPKQRQRKRKRGTGSARLSN